MGELRVRDAHQLMIIDADLNVEYERNSPVYTRTFNLDADIFVDSRVWSALREIFCAGLE